jgi:hypothetical protein
VVYPDGAMIREATGFIEDVRDWDNPRIDQPVPDGRVAAQELRWKKLPQEQTWESK